MDILLKKIELPEYMIRRSISESGIKGLSDSIKAVGIINALVVRKKGDGYELVAGLRRYMAADMAGLEKVPVKVIKKGDQLAEKIKIDENLLREPVNPIEEGAYFKVIMKKLNISQKGLAKLNGLSEAYISQRISTMKWPGNLKSAVKEGSITFSVAREFALVNDEEERKRMIDRAVKNGCSPAMAARWRIEANRDSMQRGTRKLADYNITCHLCGEQVDEQKVKTMNACPECRSIIKQGQEEGLFK